MNGGFKNSGFGDKVTPQMGVSVKQALLTKALQQIFESQRQKYKLHPFAEVGISGKLARSRLAQLANAS